jgi:asparagine synthase (glutamine-hydrolysing)
VIRRSKVGFDIPAHEWLRGPLRALLLDTLGSVGSEHSQFFRQSGIEAAVNRHLNGAKISVITFGGYWSYSCG